MESIEEYINRRKTWKPIQINFRGNPDNKKFIQGFKEANGFTNEGETLDYIVLSFVKSQELLKQLSIQLAEKNSEIQKLNDRAKEFQDEVRRAGQADSLRMDELEQKLANALKSDGAQSLAQNLELQTELNEARKYKFVPDERFAKLLRATEVALPKLFGIKADAIAISNIEFLNLLLEYCERDPSNEFPFKPEAEKIVNRWLEGAANNATHNEEG